MALPAPLGTSVASIASHITVIDGKPTTNTRDIAEVFGKQHDNVLRDVRQRMAEVGDEWRLLNFEETVVERKNPSGGEPIKSPVIRMTEKGFMFVVQKFTGKKAVAMQIAYVDEFERMRNALTQPTPTPRRAMLTHNTGPVLSEAIKTQIEQRAWQISGEAHTQLRQWLTAQAQRCVNPDGTPAPNLDNTLASADFAAFCTHYGSKHMQTISALLRFVHKESGELITRVEAETQKLKAQS